MDRGTVGVEARRILRDSCCLSQYVLRQPTGRLPENRQRSTLRRDKGAHTLNQPHTRDVDPQFFGSPHAPLFGLYHDPAPGQKRRSGVVICPPLGEEIFPANRMLRVLATQLARAGFPVLRFDYLGCGNSWADDLDVTVPTCLDSLSRAVGKVREQSGCERVAVIGLRFGGTIAGMSAAASPGLFHECVMWDPVLDGKAYLGELQQELRETVEQHVAVTSSRDTSVSRIEARRNGYVEVVGPGVTAAEIVEAQHGKAEASQLRRQNPQHSMGREDFFAQRWADHDSTATFLASGRIVVKAEKGGMRRTKKLRIHVACVRLIQRMSSFIAAQSRPLAIFRQPPGGPARNIL